MTILPYITIESWLTIISLAIALIVYLFRIDRKVIFYFARRKKPWAVKAAQQSECGPASRMISQSGMF